MVCQMIAVVIVTSGKHDSVTRPLNAGRGYVWRLFRGVEGFTLADVVQQVAHGRLRLFGILTADHRNAVVGCAQRNEGIASIDMLAIQRGPGSGAGVAAVGTLGHLHVLFGHSGAW